VSVFKRVGRSYPSCPFRDVETVKRQMERKNFSPTVIYAIGKRCIWGFPQVIVCRPLNELKPFPTTFWLTCPWLIKECGRCESCGGVGALEGYMSSRSVEWSSYNSGLRLLRLSLLSKAEGKFLRLRRRSRWNILQRTLIGGIGKRQEPSMKCLHLQVAAWLAVGCHPGEEWLSAHFPAPDCIVPSQYPCHRE